MKQYYKIAGLTVQMNTFGRTEKQARPYLLKKGEEEQFDRELQPDIIIRTDWQSLKEQQPHLSEEDCEYLTSGGSFYRQLIPFDGMMLHASAVIREGKAWLFSAPCGTGKSTHTALWRKVFGEEQVQMLNDDKPALRLEAGEWYAYGTPWSGKYDYNTNCRVPLGGICFLSQAKENRIEPLTGSRAVFALLDQTARPQSAAMRGQLMNLLEQLVGKVSIWKMECNMEPEAAYMSWKAMAGHKDKTYIL